MPRVRAAPSTKQEPSTKQGQMWKRFGQTTAASSSAQGECVGKKRERTSPGTRSPWYMRYGRFLRRSEERQQTRLQRRCTAQVAAKDSSSGAVKRGRARPVEVHAVAPPRCLHLVIARWVIVLSVRSSGRKRGFGWTQAEEGYPVVDAEEEGVGGLEGEAKLADTLDRTHLSRTRHQIVALVPFPPPFSPSQCSLDPHPPLMPSSLPLSLAGLNLSQAAEYEHY
eukprot:747668-Rhodomonas_salina.1